MATYFDFMTLKKEKKKQVDKRIAVMQRSFCNRPIKVCYGNSDDECSHINKCKQECEDGLRSLAYPPMSKFVGFLLYLC